MIIKDRQSTHVYKQKQMLSEEELEKREKLCVYEQPAYCVAACPLKLDAKAFLKAAADGDMDKARQLYDKIAPLPHILSAGCGMPCESACKLSELGDAVDISAVEVAAVEFGKPKQSGIFRAKKKKTVAIFGSGLFCSFLAGELEKKNYPLTVFCGEADCLSFLAAGADGIGKDALKADAELLQRMDIKFEFNSALSAAFIEEKREGFDIVCMSDAAARLLLPEVVLKSEWMTDADASFVLGAPAGQSVTEAAFDAKKAALSVDRLAQNLSPGNLRGDEGAIETRLYTNTEGVSALTRVKGSGEGGRFTKEEAIAEAQRCIQCRCDECIKGCAYLQHYKKFPRILTREIYNNVGIIMGDHIMNKPINACSLCGQCKVLCPNGYDMAEICKMARENMVWTDKMPLAPHEFALMDMLFSNGDAFLSKPQPGFDKCRYVFFPGCQASAIAPETVRAAYEDLCSRLEGGVALMLGCCGAICDWAGRYEMYDDTKEFIDRELAKLGDPVMIAGCPTCKKELLGHEGAQVVGIWDILNEIGLPEGAEGLGRPAALHDSCGARGDEGTQKAIRTIAEKLGVELVDTAYSGDRSPCCGYGGLTAYANREVAKEMTEKCLERSEEPYISYCMACRDRFAREGRESRHILELVYGTDAGAPPDISEKRYNRLNLKNSLLRELWGETPKEEILDFEIKYTEEALKQMDERMILKSDVIGVIKSIRETGESILDEETGLLIGRHRLGNVTFWVKYTVGDDGAYTVQGAYSHRMRIEKRL